LKNRRVASTFHTDTTAQFFELLCAFREVAGCHTGLKADVCFTRL